MDFKEYNEIIFLSTQTLREIMYKWYNYNNLVHFKAGIVL